MTIGSGVRVGMIGLGSMGLGMAKAMIGAGLAVRGYDLSPTALKELDRIGGESATGVAAAAAGADILVVVVVNAAQTEAALFEGGAAAAMVKGGVIVSCATMAPAHARKLAEQAGAAGLLYLDAPMSGGTQRAAAGELSFMASGSAEAFERAEPVLAAMAGTVHRLGDEAGIGASFKMVNQLLAGVHIAAACEAMAFAGRLGLDLRKVYEVILVSAGNSWMFENRVPHILDGDYSPRSAINIFTKDLGIVSDMGRAETFPLALASAALQMYVMTAAAGMGGEDDSSVARMLAGLAGIALPEKVA